MAKKHKKKLHRSRRNPKPRPLTHNTRKSMIQPGIYSCESTLAGGKNTSLSPEEQADLMRQFQEYACLFYLHIKNLEITKDGFSCIIKSLPVYPSKEWVRTRYEEFYQHRYRFRPVKAREKLKQLKNPAFINRQQKALCSISCFMQRVKNCFAKAYNRRHERKGPVFKSRFKSLKVAIQNLAEFLQEIVLKSDEFPEIRSLPGSYNGILVYPSRE